MTRGQPPRTLFVATNLAGLHEQPSHDARLSSQLLNGCLLQVLRQQDQWCLVVGQADGYMGWAYRPYLTATAPAEPTHLVCDPVSVVRSAPMANTPILTRVPGGTLVQVLERSAEWTQLALAGGIRGWVPVADVRALRDLPKGEVARRWQIVADAVRFTGVPFLWGGCTAMGTDCSGFTQLLHRLVGVAIPRDAEMQYAAGAPSEHPYQPGDLLFFLEPGEAREITHAGVSLGGWKMIHSSRSRNGVYEDDLEAAGYLRERFVGGRTFLIR
jgi:cell wall-associated NlpC family hydrolase